MKYINSILMSNKIFKLSNQKKKNERDLVAHTINLSMSWVEVGESLLVQGQADLQSKS